ncbi:M16 family metallopeptidase [Dyella agri]|uniref:Insulinase family protein n=1 Tax=Dyella agri TaxID=1926869 RepID=A0ABW8KI39_9GAMM
MHTLRSSLFALLFTCTPLFAVAAPATDTVDLKYEKFQLPNGLTVVVHEDHKAPVVAVSIWYHIGSADEPQGKTGFAHLFEHLMFSGSEHHKGSYLEAFDPIGATDMNGTTWFDRTNYFETVPTTAVDLALWMESDRMGHLLGAIGQKELDTQRGVVQNEKRQGENRPYGRVSELYLKNIFPTNHPYQHDTIGSMADLDAASLADVKAWFRCNYGAANTTLVLAGDITPAIARAKVMKYFGDIPAGPAVAHQQPWITPLGHRVDGVQHDHVAQTRIYRTWVVPQDGSDDALNLDLATTILGGGKSSRLYQRLVYRDKLVDDVSVSLSPFALASMLEIQADLKDGVDLAKVDAAIDEELKRFRAEGPSADELARAQVRYRGEFVRNVESVSDQARVLAEGQVYRDDPGAFRKDLSRIAAATVAGVRKAADTWLSRGDYHLKVLPAGKDFDPAAEDAKVASRAAMPGRPATVLPPARRYSVAQSGVDRSEGVPKVASFPTLQFPALQRARLKNGIEVVLAERHAVPVTQVELMFDAGYAADHGRRPGTAAFATSLLEESTKTLDSTEVAIRKERLGARIGAACGLDSCIASLNALEDRLVPSLALFADTVRNPAFKASDIARLREQHLAEIAQSKSSPMGVAQRILPPLLYGKEHAYGIPFDGLGSVADVKAMTAADFTAFQRDYLRPDNLKILVVGDTTLAGILPQLDAAFGDWQAPATPRPRKNLASVAVPAKPRLFLIDRPDAPQSLILAGLLVPSAKAPDYLTLRLANDALGGSFSSRLNMNLREDKHWAYGAHTMMSDTSGQGPMFFYAPVQTDKTAPSIAETLKEARAIVGDKPVTEAEIGNIRDMRVRALPGAYETSDAVLGTVTKIVKFGWPDDYVQTLKTRIEGVTPATAETALKEVVKPEAMTWVIVGDLRKIEQPVRALGIGDVEVLDADGHTVH